MILAIDVDGVTADLHATWIRRYNQDYGDILQYDEIGNWRIQDAVKPECGDKIYDYIKDPTIYNDVKPIKGALEGVTSLRNMGHRIVFASACLMGTADSKWMWLNKHGFLHSNLDHGTDPDWLAANDKTLVRTDILLDDKFENVASFPGIGVLFTQPWNRNKNWYLRVNSWQGFVNTITNMDKLATSGIVYPVTENIVDGL